MCTGADSLPRKPSPLNTPSTWTSPLVRGRRRYSTDSMGAPAAGRRADETYESA
jgi:hypothetical protein